MKVITNEIRAEIQDIAERLIGNYILAVEHNHLDAASFNWITETDHWEIDLSEGRQLLSLISFTNIEIDKIENDVREKLEEKEQETNEDD